MGRQQRFGPSLKTSRVRLPNSASARRRLTCSHSLHEFLSQPSACVDIHPADPSFGARRDGPILLPTGLKKWSLVGSIRSAAEYALQRGGVLQFLQRADLHLDGGGLCCEPLIFAGEGVLAESLLCCRHLQGSDLEQAGERELARALLVQRAQDRVFQVGQHSLDGLGVQFGLGDRWASKLALVKVSFSGLATGAAAAAFLAGATAFLAGAAFLAAGLAGVFTTAFALVAMDFFVWLLVDMSP